MSTPLTNIHIVNILDNMKAHEESLEQLIWQLRRAFRELTAAADRELHALGIQAGDRALLEFLAREMEPISLSDLAKKYSVSRQHIHQTLRRLPHPEWVEETPDPNDRRTVLLSLSPKGQSFWNKIRDSDRAFLKQLAKCFSEHRMAATATFLKQLRRELRVGRD
jgi:DNA-binding MarR family transcriptional regulator